MIEKLREIEKLMLKRHEAGYRQALDKLRALIAAEDAKPKRGRPRNA